MIGHGCIAITSFVGLYYLLGARGRRGGVTEWGWGGSVVFFICFWVVFRGFSRFAWFQFCVCLDLFVFFSFFFFSFCFVF